MANYDNFIKAEKIFEGANTIYYRGHRVTDGTSVILKSLKTKVGEGVELSLYSQETVASRSLQHKGILRPLEIARIEDELALVLEDFEGKVLEKVLRQKEGISIEYFLRIAAALADVISYIHGNNTFHGHITPDNILVDLNTCEVRLTGIINPCYDQSDALSQEWFGNLYTASYISPEQTGRIKRQVDYRTDLYSLGIMFYEMLSGALPFKNDDYLEIMHFHLAGKPRPIYEENPWIPHVLWEILEKLLQKNPESRYPSAMTLKEDLEACLKNIEYGEEKYYINSAIGLDKPGKELEPPRNVIGREAELDIIYKAFDVVKENGIPRLVMVSGQSGIGKTTLVNEASYYIKENGGSFIHGKYEQYKRNTPYSSIIQAFDAFFKDILVQNKESVEAWKERFQHGIGHNANVLINIFPSLGKVIGPQKEVEEIPLSEAQNRLIQTFTNFLQVAASRERPLVVFLDDLQWVDSSSIRLLEHIFSGVEDIYILVVGGYRNNEVDDSHPVRLLLDKLWRTGFENLAEIELLQLDRQHVHEIIIEMLNYDSKQIEKLAEFCHEKSGGNPFILYQYMLFIKDEHILYFCKDSQEWCIASEQLFIGDGEKDVAELILRKMEKLADGTIEALKLAACINNEFNAELLSELLDVHMEDMERSLLEAQNEGLIQNHGDGRYRFSHDRLLQAAYFLVDERQRKEFHYRLGKLLLEKSPVLEEGENLFEIVEHLSIAEDITNQMEENFLMAKLYLESGKRAKDFGAHERALEYLGKGMESLAEKGWKADYGLTLCLYTECTEVAYICGQYELMEKFGDAVLEKGKSLFDKVKIYEIKIDYLSAQNKFDEAFDTARKVLRLFGIHVPLRPGKLRIMAKYIKTRIALIGRKLKDIKNLPEMTDEKQLAIMRILASPSAAAYTFNGPFMVMLILNVVEISLKYGNAPLTPVAYVAYGHFLAAYLNKRKLGYEFGRIGLDIQANIRSKAYECKTSQIYETLVRYNKEPLVNSVKGFPAIHKNGINSGDFTSAGHIMMQHYVYSYFCGRPLQIILQEIDEYKADLIKTNNRTATSICMMYAQSMKNLNESIKEPWMLEGEYFSEKAEKSYFEVINDITALSNLYLNKTLIFFLFGQFEEAMKSLHAAESCLEGVTGTYAIPVYHFYGALIHLQLMTCRASKNELKARNNAVQKHLNALEKYFKDVPENSENKYFLIKAEISRIAGEHALAVKYYDNSLLAAGRDGFIQEEAIAAELAARYFASCGEKEKAEKYLKQANYCYLKWGCPLKAEQLQDNEEKGQDKIAAVSSSTSLKAQDVDIETIMRASQAISEELVLSELLEKMIRIVIQNAGATRALFIMEQDGKLYTEVEGRLDNNKVKVAVGALLDKSQKEILKILNYVYNTGEGIIFKNQKEIDAFIGEGKRDTEKEKSVLCFPVNSKRSFIGILFLENNLMDGAFTDQHMLILKIIASQLAISIENARLYQNIERVVEERTEQLKKKNQELEYASNAKDAFLANMSHEMRTPLHGIIGMAGLLKKDASGIVSEDMVENIIFSANSLLEIINDILDFSKLQANMSYLNERDFELNQLIREILPAFKIKAEEKGLELSYDIIGEKIWCLRGDPTKIKQIIINLLGNSVKFTERGKVELIISVGEEGHRNAKVEIIVKDTGIGIPKDKLDNIFQDFVQVDSSAARKYGGTGLGLPITKKLVTLMKGEITVDSELGMGSCFHCKILLAKSNVGSMEYEQKEDTDLKAFKDALSPFTILVAEDNPISSKYIKAMLEYIGCSVLLACDGTEVLAKLRTGKVDCILMDKNMPGLDGIETTRIIRSSEEANGMHLPIIALTASAIAGECERLLSEGMDYYLSKPLDEHKLIRILKEIKADRVDECHGDVYDNSIEEGLVDREVFLEEAELFGKEVMLEIIIDFFEGYEEKLKLIKGGIAAGEYARVEKEVHRMAGTLSTFHCGKLVKLLKEMEIYAAEKQLEELIQSYILIEKNLAVLVRELRKIVGYLEEK